MARSCQTAAVPVWAGSDVVQACAHREEKEGLSFLSTHLFVLENAGTLLLVKLISSHITTFKTKTRRPLIFVTIQHHTSLQKHLGACLPTQDSQQLFLSHPPSPPSLLGLIYVNISRKGCSVGKTSLALRNQHLWGTHFEGGGLLGLVLVLLHGLTGG